MWKQLLLLLTLLKPAWMQRKDPDEEHFYRRTFTKRYQAKLRLVKNLWIVSGLLMLAFPLLPFIASLGLFTTFISFSILDETA